MSTRRLLHAGILAAAVLTLAACGPDDPAAAPDSAGTTAATSPSAGASDPDAGPSADCPPPKAVAGHQHVHVTAKPAGTTLKAQLAKFACDPNDGHYEGTGATKTFTFAAKVTARVTQGSGAYKTVTLPALSQHINDCLTGATVEPPNFCAGNIYDITLDPTAHITTITEIWHP